MSGEITMNCELNKTSVAPAGQPQLVYVLLEIRPGQAVANVRMPLNFSLVLDKSGSMSGEKIRQLREAVKRLVGLMEEDDVISIIVFDGNTSVVAGSQRVKDRRKLEKAVDGIEAEDGTNMGPAMAEGLKQLDKERGPGRVSRMVVLTDGQTADEDECIRQARQAGIMGIPVIALGIGTDWNETLLQNVGAESGGRADYIAGPQDIDPIFQEVWAGMQVVAGNLNLSLRLVQGVEARKLWQVTPLIKDLSGQGAIAGRSVAMPLENLEEGGLGLLIELMLPPKPFGQYRIGQAEVSYDVPQLKVIAERVRADLIINFTTDPYSLQQINPRVMNIVEKVTAFKLQTRALDEATMGNLAGATQKLRAAATILLDQGEDELARTYQQEADRLQQQGHLSEEGRRTIKFGSSKTVKL